LTLLWTQRQDIGPSGRLGHGLVYDAQRKRTVLVGGDGLTARFRDTWLWDGEAWTQVDDMGPTGRSGHGVAYDNARSRAVLFGGSDGASELADTWEWDGKAWTQVADTGPSARTRTALAFDSKRSRVVLFGGEGSAGALADTWEWDGNEWTQVADSGPSARRGHAMCFEDAAQRTVLFGGSNASDTWSWDGAHWTAVNDLGPAPCEDTALVSAGTSTILFGGHEHPLMAAKLSALTWELTGSNWTERQDMGPTPRFGHAAAYDVDRERVVLFGGSRMSPAADGDLLSDTWELPVGGGAIPAAGPQVVVFHIPVGGNTTSWNTAAMPVVAKVGDTLRLVNDDVVAHRLHTDGMAPFAHPAMDIGPGQSADFLLQNEFGPPGYLYDHDSGPNIRFFIQVLPA
jgi:hypothetical protein